MTIASHVELHAKYMMVQNSIFGSVAFDDYIQIYSNGKDIYRGNLQKKNI